MFGLRPEAKPLKGWKDEDPRQHGVQRRPREEEGGGPSEREDRRAQRRRRPGRRHRHERADHRRPLGARSRLRAARSGLTPLGDGKGPSTRAFPIALRAAPLAPARTVPPTYPQVERMLGLGS
jgi:hypothetical protein